MTLTSGASTNVAVHAGTEAHTAGLTLVNPALHVIATPARRHSMLTAAWNRTAARLPGTRASADGLVQMNVSRATEGGRRRRLICTGAAPACTNAAAGKRRRRSDALRLGGRGKGHGEVQQLTHDARACSARSEEARSGRNRRRSPPG